MARRLRLVYNLDNSKSFKPPPRKRPVDGLPYGQTEQRTSHRREYGYSPPFGIAVHRVNERDLATLTGLFVPEHNPRIHRYYASGDALRRHHFRAVQLICQRLRGIAVSGIIRPSGSPSAVSPGPSP
jgi:hypothetical protein